jgi:Core-2/I-Branching enzyme
VNVACVVLAHRLPDQLRLLLGALRHPQLRIYLHVDRRADLQPFSAASAASGAADVQLLERRRTRWGGIEVIDVVLDALRRGTRDGCGYFFVVSGQDFPLRSAHSIVDFASAAGTRSYVEHWEIPTPRWRFGGRDRTDFYSYNVLGRRETCIPRGCDTGFFNWKGRAINELLRIWSAPKPSRRFPSYVRPFGGWSWLNLSAAAAEYILAFVDEHPGYRSYHRHTLSADEVFFHSILLGTEFASRHEVVSDSLRFMLWPEASAHPRILTEDDLPAMLASEALFARKFDTAVEARVLAHLSERVAA